MSGKEMRLTSHNKWMLGQFVLVKYPDLSKQQFGVMIRLLDHHNSKTGRCFPSIGKLAKYLGCCRKTVSKAIGKLEALNLISVRRNRGPGGTNLYRFPKWREKIADFQRTDLGQRDAGLEDIDDEDEYPFDDETGG